jgi:hypothetical protein
MGVNILKNSDTLHVVMSDMHSGSNHALFLSHEWQGEETPVIYPRGAQAKIRKHFEDYAAQVKTARKGVKVRLILNGDLIEGWHHAQNDVATMDIVEQAEINIELVEEFKNKIDWQRGDELYIVKGTHVHTGDMENHIGKQINAMQNGKSYCFETLELMTNGVRCLIAHHGPGAGEGHNEGNAMTNFLKRIYFSRMKDGDPIPDILYTGHVHSPTYAAFVTRQKMEYKIMHGVILPSWQEKTRYAHMRAPVSVNRIGGIWQMITAGGLIGVPQFCVMDSK